MHDPEADTRQQVTADISAALDDKVFMLYRRLPDGARRPGDLLRSVFQGSALDSAAVVITGFVALLLALVWPFAGQHLFEGGISPLPVIALMALAGLASGLSLIAFQMLQARLFARATHRAITIFWDRIVRLPVAFVRQGRSETLGQVADSMYLWLVRLQDVVGEGWLALPAIAFSFALCDMSLALGFGVLIALGVAVCVSVYSM